MTILRPSLETQSINTIIPRYYPNSVVLTLLNEETQTLNTFTISPTYSNGYMFLDFEFTCLEMESFNLEIKDGNTVLFRGKAFATDETDLENYKLSKNILQ
jgi:hypothetical protein